jgi:glutaconate CoA-transferase subunit A
MSDAKLYSLEDAISRFVPDGSAVALGTAQESLIPFAAGHEIMRQKNRNLTLIGPISDILFDQIIGAGCVARIRAAWVGNVITGSSYNFRRAVEAGALEMEDHSNLTVSMALRAGAMGVPFMPARTALGSDLYRTNRSLKTITCPFTGDTLTAVAAINPDVTIIHVQRADAQGNAHSWGNLGITREACLASRHIIVTAEEIVAPEVIQAVPGYYNRDHDAFIAYQQDSKTPEAFDRWQAHWIDAVKSSDEYLNLLGEEKMSELAIKHHALTEVADYGY